MAFDLKKLTPYLPWIERGAVLVVIIILAVFWNRSHSERSKLVQEVESLKLKSQGYADDQEKKQRDLERMAKDLLVQDVAWKAQVTELEKLLGETPKVIRVVEIRTETKPVVVLPGTPPRECPADGKQVILVEGDGMHAELKEIDWGTKSNNNVMTGRISCFRDTPSPLLLHTQLINSKQPSQANVFVPPTEQSYRWGAGAFVSLTKTGWAAGPKLLFPPFDLNLWLFKVRTEADVGVALGSGGERVVQLGAGGRFR